MIAHHKNELNFCWCTGNSQNCNKNKIVWQCLLGNKQGTIFITFELCTSEGNVFLLLLQFSFVLNEMLLDDENDWTRNDFLSLFLSIVFFSRSYSLFFFFFCLIFLLLQHHGNCFRSEHIDTSISIDWITSHMLSYLQPQLASDSMLAICSTSADDLNKANYHHEDDHEGLFHSASAALASTSASRFSYAQTHHHKSSMPFVYGTSTAPSYGFGFGLYEDMSMFSG